MTKASDNVFPRLLVSEGGSTSTPASGQVTVYAKADGLLYSKDDAGTETLVSGGGVAPLAVLRYAGGSDTFYTGTASLADVDAANLSITFTAPTSGKVIVSCVAMVQNGSGIAYWGLRESTTDIAGPQMVSNLAAPTIGARSFYLTGISAGSHTYKFAMQNGALFHGPTYGDIEMTIWAA